jgi:hypothetical protein
MILRTPHPNGIWMGIIKLIVEQADSLFFMNIKGNYEK